ncbi:MAG: protein kinase domain-containing protein [Actinomycetota bacterium]
MADARIGSLVAGYRIESLIGRGGMSVVYLAHHEGLERKAALKLLAPELAENEAFRQRFIRESRMAAGLDHPNVIPVYDAGEADGLLYIAMRYVRGSDLKTLLAEHGPLELPDVVQVMDQLGAALDAAHAEGLVHRDVKPANVLLSPATPPAVIGHLYLADFGLTKKSLSGSGITKSGQFVGTIDYVAPEQIRSDLVDGRTDVYSAGCVLYECLTGEPPFVRDSEVAVMFAHLNDPPPRPSALRLEVPAGIDAVVAKAMAKAPDRRYPSAGDLGRAAHDALRPALAPVRESLVPVDPGAARRRRRVLLGGAGGALIAMIALIVAIVAGGNGPPGPSGGPSTTASASLNGPALLTGFRGLLELDPESGTESSRVPLELPNMPAPGALRPLLAGEGSIWVAAPASDTEVVKVDPVTGEEVDRLTLLSTTVLTLSFAAGQSSVWILTDAGPFGPGSDTLFRIDPATDEIVARITVGSTGHGVAVGPEGVWVVKADGSLIEIDSGTNRIARTIQVGTQASGVALAGGAVWVSDNIAGVVYRVNPVTEKVRTIHLPGGVDGIAADSTGVWVLDRSIGFVVPIDPATGQVGQQIRVGAHPNSIAVGAGFVWVADPGEASIWRIDPSSHEPKRFPVAQDPGPGWVSVGESGVWTTLTTVTRG